MAEESEVHDLGFCFGRGFQRSSNEIERQHRNPMRRHTVYGSTICHPSHICCSVYTHNCINGGSRGNTHVAIHISVNMPAPIVVMFACATATKQTKRAIVRTHLEIMKLNQPNESPAPTCMTQGPAKWVEGPWSWVSK